MRGRNHPSPRLKERDGERRRRKKRERERAYRPLDTDEETPTPIDSVDLGILPRSPAGFAIARAIPFLIPPFTIVASRSRDVPSFPSTFPSTFLFSPLRYSAPRVLSLPPFVGVSSPSPVSLAGLFSSISLCARVPFIGFIYCVWLCPFSFRETSGINATS